MSVQKHGRLVEWYHRWLMVYQYMYIPIVIKR